MKTYCQSSCLFVCIKKTAFRAALTHKKEVSFYRFNLVFLLILISPSIIYIYQRGSRPLEGRKYCISEPKKTSLGGLSIRKDFTTFLLKLFSKIQHCTEYLHKTGLGQIFHLGSANYHQASHIPS